MGVGGRWRVERPEVLPLVQRERLPVEGTEPRPHERKPLCDPRAPGRGDVSPGPLPVSLL